MSGSYTLVEGRSSLPGTPGSSPPPSRDALPKAQVSPANSDDSSLACDLSDLSFNYERGEIVRRGSSKPSSPPTPVDSPPLRKSTSPVPPPITYARAAPLQRSESLPQESLYNPRLLQRTVSGPLSNTPAASSRSYTALATSNAATGRKIGGPRRVRLDDHSEADVQPRIPLPAMASMSLDEKENLRAGRVIRPARSMGKHLGYDKIAEVNEDAELAAAAAVPLPGNPHLAPRPRRSASLSDAPPPIDPLPERPLAHVRPGTALGARRVTLEEKLRQEREIALEEGYATARREAEEAAGVFEICCITRHRLTAGQRVLKHRLKNKHTRLRL